MTRQQFVEGVLELAERIDSIEKAGQLLHHLDRALAANDEKADQRRANVERLHAEFDAQDRWVREFLEQLHNASTLGTLLT